jgi:SAM-dependent methyltransferase
LKEKRAMTPENLQSPQEGVAEAWERHAAWWQREFTNGADVEYVEQILPLAADQLAGADLVLDLGCGEGQVARLAAAGGADRVVGLDPAAAQLAAAVRRGGGVAYARGLGGALPFASGSFDAVVVCLVLEHVVDVDATFDEIARVLGPGGRLVLFLNHPLFQTPGSGWIDDRVLDPPEQYWRVGPYLHEDVSLEEVEAGVRLPFVHRPLSRYVNGLADRGLVVTHMDEPAPPPGFVALAPEYAGATTIPRLLLLRAEKGGH